ncbi:MAG TPA: ankyrin repeat domain-containing protein [Yeosuana sp.]
MIIRFLLSIYLVSVCNQMQSQNNIFDIARNGCKEDLQEILYNHPEVINYKNTSGFTPLILACYNGNIEVASLLAKKVDDINSNSSYGTALMAAVFKNDFEITKMLLDLGANTNLSDTKGNTALHFATLLNNKEITKLLIDYGADANFKDNKGFSPMDYAMQTKNRDISNLLKN